MLSKPFAALGTSLANIRQFSRIKHRFNSRSLKQRLLISACLWLVLVVTTAAIFLPQVVQSYLYDQLNDQAELYLDDLSAFVDVSPEGMPILLESIADPRFRKPYSGWYWQIKTTQGELRSRSLWDASFDIDREKGPDEQQLLFSSRTLSLGEQSSEIELTVAIDAEPTEETLEVLSGGILITLAMIAFSLLVLLWLQIQWSLKPMVTLQYDLLSVREGKDDKLQGHYPSEVQPVVDDLNRLLFHYGELLERARHHTGNLAHALKTPLSIIQNEVAQLPQAQQPILLSAIHQLQERMNYHLARARVAGSSQILAAQSCPADVVDNVTMAFETAYADRDVVLVNELDDDIQVAVDTRDLEEMLGNLIENAFKWSSGLIRVHSESADNQLSILVNDNGPGLKPEQMEQVLQRGVRMDEQTPGTGLGLNIVCEIARSYQGELRLSSSAMGGLQAVLILPLVPAA